MTKLKNTETKYFALSKNEEKAVLTQNSLLQEQLDCNGKNIKYTSKQNTFCLMNLETGTIVHTLGINVLI